MLAKVAGRFGIVLPVQARFVEGQDHALVRVSRALGGSAWLGGTERQPAQGERADGEGSVPHEVLLQSGPWAAGQPSSTQLPGSQTSIPTPEPCPAVRSLPTGSPVSI